MSVIVKFQLATFTVTIATPAVFSLVGHGLAAGDIVYMKTTGALPTGLAEDTAYYVIATGLTADAFRVSTSLGGSAVNTTGSQSGVHTLSVDHTEDVEYNSLSVARALTSQVDTAKFDIIRPDSSGWSPALLDDVKIFEDGTAIFGGTVIETESEIRGGDIEVFHVTCKDYSFDLDRQLVADTYENLSVEDIINDIVDNYTTGFTHVNVVAAPVVAYVAFKYEYPTKCIQQLCELIGYDWYIDEDKDLHVFAKEDNPSPFNLTDDGGLYYYETLKIKGDVKNLRNTIIVRGGQYQGDTLTEQQVADGESITFKWAYKYANTAFELDGSPLDVGVDFINEPTDHDALYNFQEKSLKFREDNKPTIGQIVALTGNPYIPVITRNRDSASEGTYGAFEYKVVDNSINSKEGARDRAAAELRAWANEINEGSFDTKEVGLKVGMFINIQSTKRGLDQDFVITRIASKLINGFEFRHSVTLATTQTFGMIEFLQKLLIQKDKELIINDDEVVDLVESVYETITIAEVVTSSKVHNPQTESMTIAEVTTVRALNYAVEFGAADSAPSGVSRVFIADGSPLG